MGRINQCSHLRTPKAGIQQAGLSDRLGDVCYLLAFLGISLQPSWGLNKVRGRTEGSKGRAERSSS